MADDTPKVTTPTQDTTVVDAQPVVEKPQEPVVETPKVEEKIEEVVPTAEPTPVAEEPKAEPVVEPPAPIEETKPIEEPKIETPIEVPEKPKDVSFETSVKEEEPKPVEEVKPVETSEPEVKVEKPESPKVEEPKKPETPQINLDELRAKANKERQDRKQEHLSEIEKLAKGKQINNDDVRELLHVSQSTATNYLEELTKSGRIKKSGKAKGTTYSS